MKNISKKEKEKVKKDKKLPKKNLSKAVGDSKLSNTGGCGRYG